MARTSTALRTRLGLRVAGLRVAGLLGAGVLAAAAGGCSAAALPVLRELTRPDQTVVSPAGEDGTRYLAVEGGPLASPAGLRSRWGVAARQVCEGDFMKLSEYTASRRQSGITRSRIHEGYIRCLLPGEQEPGAGPTMAEAEAPARSRRGRRANVARTRWAQ
jgi:hypothetical protein